MASLRIQKHLVFVRFCIVAMSLPSLPGLVILAWQWWDLKTPLIVPVVLVCAALVSWVLLARWLLVQYRFKCPQCGARSGRTETVGRELYLVCEACGMREQSGYEWSDAGG
jgi:hypothetical protein